MIDEIATYVVDGPDPSEEAMVTARWCLYDSLGCALLALDYPACSKLLGPVIPGMEAPQGCRTIGRGELLDPVIGAFNNGAMIRWLDYNDTWLAKEWGHPSDNFAGLLAVGDLLCRQGRAMAVEDILKLAVRAYEVQGVLALGNSLNRVGYDHVLFVKIATAAVVTAMLGGSKDDVAAALSQAFIDSGPLRTYRHAPNTGSRKSWAAGDAAARGVYLACLTMAGEPGYATPLTAEGWGFQDVVMHGQRVILPQPLGSYVMENVLFKVSFPAEFHAQTAVEAAVQLHPQVKGRWEHIDKIEVETHESALRIIDKTGPLRNPADRDHCLQYMVAVALLEGGLAAEHYEEEYARRPLIDQLRGKMVLKEDKAFSQDYLDPGKRSIANRLKVVMEDGAVLGPVTVEYPLGHRKRRTEAWPKIEAKCRANLAKQLGSRQVESLLDLLHHPEKLHQTPVADWVDMTRIV